MNDLGPNQEGCEEIEISSGDGAECDQSTYGCCPDGVTAATGPNNRGCYVVDVDIPDKTRVTEVDQATEVDIGFDRTTVEGKDHSKVGHCDLYCIMFMG